MELAEPARSLKVRSAARPEPGLKGNKFLKISAVGNHSFTGIVNHTRQDLRHGKNSCFTFNANFDRTSESGESLRKVC